MLERVFAEVLAVLGAPCFSSKQKKAKGERVKAEFCTLFVDGIFAKEFVRILIISYIFLNCYGASDTKRQLKRCKIFLNP